MKLPFLIFFGSLSAVLLFGLTTHISAQTVVDFEKVRISVISQRHLTADEMKWDRPEMPRSTTKTIADDLLGPYYDVFLVGEGDDLTIRFRLENGGNKPVFVLVENDLPNLPGYLLFREDSSEPWKATWPGRGREGGFTGGAFKWQSLGAGKSVEFEYTDLSTRPGERAVSVYINNTPTHKGRVELISDTYQPLRNKVKSSCAISSDAVRGEDGELTIFTSEELMERVRKTEPVERPLNLKKNNIFGTMIVDVVVDKDGRLSCISPTEGHPLAAAAVVKSLRKWVFKKYRSPTGTKTMIGVLAVPYDFR